MKGTTIKLALFIGLMAFLDNSYAQYLKEPKYVGNVHYIPSNNSAPIKLERQTTNYKRKVMLFDGATSSIRIDSTGTIRMVVKVLDNNIDPINTVRVYKIRASERKDYRYMPLRNDNPLKIKFIDYDKIERINIESDPFGNSSYLIYLNQLSPGEYVIAVDNDKNGWNLFSIK